MSLVVADLVAPLLSAEAFAEMMHEDVRRQYWGYARDEQYSAKELHQVCGLPGVGVCGCGCVAVCLFFFWGGGM